MTKEVLVLWVVMVVEEASPAAARAVYNAMSKKEKFEKKPLFVSNYAIFSHS